MCSKVLKRNCRALGSNPCLPAFKVGPSQSKLKKAHLSPSPKFYKRGTVQITMSIWVYCSKCLCLFSLPLKQPNVSTVCPQFGCLPVSPSRLGSSGLIHQHVAGLRQPRLGGGGDLVVHQLRQTLRGPEEGVGLPRPRLAIPGMSGMVNGGTFWLKHPKRYAANLRPEADGHKLEGTKLIPWVAPKKHWNSTP